MPNVTTDPDLLKITKSNQLIEVTFVEPTRKLSVRDQKLILSIIGQISPEDEDFKTYRVTIDEIHRMTGICKQDLYKELLSMCIRLTSCGVVIKEPSNKDGFIVANWFADAEYIPKESVVIFSVSRRLKPYLLQLKKHFTTYHLGQVVNLNSVYSIRTYEILRQYFPLSETNNASNTAFRKISVDDLRGYLGISKTRYPRFRDFRKYVIDKSQNELCEKTDIAFDYTVEKVGRKAGYINFRIRNNPKFEEIKEEDITGDHIPVNNQEVNLEAENFVRAVIQMQLPEINLIEQDLILKTYPREMIMESLLSLSTIEIRTTRKKAFLGILSGKRKDEQQAADSSDSDEDFSWLQKDF